MFSGPDKAMLYKCSEILKSSSYGFAWWQSEAVGPPIVSQRLATTEPKWDGWPIQV